MTGENVGNQQPVYKSPLPAKSYTLDDIHYYYMAGHHAAKMIRPDGLEIVFTHHFFATNNSADVAYLDNEIAERMPGLREANEDEVHAYGMRTDPKKTITADLLNDPESELIKNLRDQLEAEFRQKYSIPESQLAGIDSKIGSGTKTATATVHMGAGSSIAEQLELKKQAETAAQTGSFKPVSTTDIKDGAAKSSS